MAITKDHRKTTFGQTLGNAALWVLDSSQDTQVMRRFRDGLLENKAIAGTKGDEKTDRFDDAIAEFVRARRLQRLPTTLRQVGASILVGQVFWYVICPKIYEHLPPQVRDHPLAALGLGGSDKLFISPDSLLYHTGGYNASAASRITNSIPHTVKVGLAALAIELSSDISRCAGEYYLQKKSGVIPDGVARAWGQTKPFWYRYSTIEVYQKIIGYAVKPFAIGTPQQIFSSIQGTLGSLWRGTVQFGFVYAFGKKVDDAVKWLSEKTGFARVGKRIEEEAKRREELALDAIKEIIGDVNVVTLKNMLEAEEQRLNPFAKSPAYNEAAQK